MSGPVLVSVVVPAFNAAPWIQRSVSSALRQTYAPIQVVVVDDGSADGTADAVHELGAGVLLVRQPNRGVSAARNAGVSASGGELVAFLDADDWWLPSKVERQVAAFEAQPELGLVHVGVLEVDSEGRRLGERLDGATGYAALDLFCGRSSVPAAGSGAMVRRAVFEEIGGFDEGLSTSADWDFCLRVAEGHPVGFVPEALLAYVVHPGGMHLNIELARRDMLDALHRAVRRRPDLYGPERTRSLAGVHRVLAGSYFHQGKTADALREGLRSIVTYPLIAPDLAAAAVRASARRARGRTGRPLTGQPL